MVLWMEILICSSMLSLNNLVKIQYVHNLMFINKDYVHIFLFINQICEIYFYEFL